jgi:ubiquitin C-terminal hydrolase
MFLREFQTVKKNQADYGSPFVPEYVYDALRGLKRFASMRGRQEDCQGFLGFLLDGLHEEFLAAMKDKPAGSERNGSADYEDSESGVSEDEWMEVTGPKNKASHTRSTQFSETPISSIFSGQLRSILRISGQKDSITMEPFQSMQLDLTPDNVHTIEDALRNSTMPEVLDGFTTSERGGATVEATKKIFIEHVPPVLVLHLKRFIYRDGGTQKLHKQVGYKTVLNLQPGMFCLCVNISN